MNDTMFASLTPRENQTLFDMLGKVATAANRLAKCLIAEHLCYVNGSETRLFRDALNTSGEVIDIRGELNTAYGVKDWEAYAVHWIEAGQSRSLVFSTAERRNAYARLLDEDSGISHIECLNYTTEKGWQS